MGGSFSRDKGARAERDLAGYLRQWFPHCCRAIRTGSSAAPDPGDLAGIPGLVVSVKHDPTRARQDGAWARWWADLDDMLSTDPAALGVIVERREHTPDPAAWWCHMRLGDLVALHSGGALPAKGDRAPVRITVATMVELLCAAGYCREVAS